MGEKNKTCNKELSKKMIHTLDLDLTDMKVTGKRILLLISQLSDKEKRELFSCNRFEADKQIYDGSFLDIISHNINNNKVVNFILDEADKYGLADFQLMDKNNHEESTALHWLASHTCPEVLTHALEVLGDNANKALSIRDKNGNTPIHH